MNYVLEYSEERSYEPDRQQGQNADSAAAERRQGSDRTATELNELDGVRLPYMLDEAESLAPNAGEETRIRWVWFDLLTDAADMGHDPLGLVDVAVAPEVARDVPRGHHLSGGEDEDLHDAELDRSEGHDLSAPARLSRAHIELEWPEPQGARQHNLVRHADQRGGVTNDVVEGRCPRQARVDTDRGHVPTVLLTSAQRDDGEARSSGRGTHEGPEIGRHEAVVGDEQSEPVTLETAEDLRFAEHERWDDAVALEPVSQRARPTWVAEANQSVRALDLAEVRVVVEPQVLVRQQLSHAPLGRARPLEPWPQLNLN